MVMRNVRSLGERELGVGYRKISAQSTRPVINAQKEALKVATFVIISFFSRQSWGWNPGTFLCMDSPGQLRETSNSY